MRRWGGRRINTKNQEEEEEEEEEESVKIAQIATLSKSGIVKHDWYLRGKYILHSKFDLEMCTYRV
jgi:hypothetical protein